LGGRHIEAIDGALAMERARKNPLRRYPSPERDGARLYPLASPTVKPGFRIGPQDTVFAIGSCFARNVEKALEGAGLRVLSREFDLGEVGASLEDGANFFNKYSIHSVLNDLTWALERRKFPGEATLLPMGPDSFVDAQLGMGRLDFPVETVMAFRHRYLDAMRAVADADVVILTLGYVETWYDRKLDLYLNVTPPVQAVKAEPGRFEFRVLSYRDVLRGLEQVHALLEKHRTKPLRMLVTVSPVPLLATFRDVDVLVANAYSKSVQRAAIEEFVLEKTGVDYFPSYEFVTLSNPEVAWSRQDYRHVSQDVINRIMDNVLSNYMDGETEVDAGLTREALASSARMLSRMERHDEALALLAENRTVVDGDADLLMVEAVAARQVKRLDIALEALCKAVVLAPNRPEPLERLIMLCRPLRLRAEARDWARQHLERFPERVDFRDRLTWL
jgi:hypothetical protein